MLLGQAKRDFECGYLNKFRIERAVLGEGWQLWLGEGNAACWLTDARTKQPRIIKSLDSALNVLEQIGFKVLILGQN